MSNNRSQRDNLKALLECAILIAIGTVLAQIKIYRMPSGGSVTAASMVPFLLVSYRHGTKWGLITSFANVLFQIVIGGIYPPVAPGAISFVFEILFDYVVAYMVLGFSRAFFMPFKKNQMLGIGLSTFFCCLLRYISSVISGFLVWADISNDGIFAVIYSISYNGIYMGPETILTIVVMCLLYKTAPSIFCLEISTN